MPVELTQDNFDAEVLQSPVPVVVDFWASWCGPCRMLAPVLDELSNEANGRYKVAKLNTDDHGDVAAKYGVSALPTLKVFQNGQVVDTLVGLQNKDRILAVIPAAEPPTEPTPEPQS